MDESSTSNGISNKRAKAGYSWRPLVVLIVGLIVSDVVFYLLIRQRFIKDEIFFIGWIMGQAAFMFVLGGGFGRAWVFSFLMAILLSLTVPVLLSSLEVGYSDQAMEGLLSLGAMIGPVIFSGCVPFLLGRAVSGYYVGSHPAITPHGRSLRMEDLFLSTVVIAAMIGTVPSIRAALSLVNESSLSGSIQICVFCATVSLLIVLPSTLGYLSTAGRIKRLLILCSVCLGFPFLTILLLSTFALTRMIGQSIMEVLLPILVPAAGCLALCLIVMRASGLRWVRDEKQVSTTTNDPLGDQTDIKTIDWPRRLNRAAALVIFAVVAIQVIAYRSIATERTKRAERLHEIGRRWAQSGGHIQHYRHSAYNLHAPKNATREEIEFVMASRTLNWISLRGCDIDERLLSDVGRQHNLQSIDLGQTFLTDEGLKQLHGLKHSSAIRLAYTRVTVEGLVPLLKGRTGNVLDLSGLGLTDADLARLPLEGFPCLVLRDNPITNSSWKKLAHATRLDIDGTKIDGRIFDYIHTPSIGADRLDIKDDQLLTYLRSNKQVHRLSLRGTPISDKCLKSMTGVGDLAFAEGPVTAAGLVASSINPTLLSLNGPQFDGTVFASKIWTIDHLDMRGSSISDADVHHLAKISALSHLDLQGCNITDAALPVLASLPLQLLDLSGTKVTGEAVAQQFKDTRVFLNSSQCSPEFLKNKPERPSILLDCSLAEDPLN